MKAKIKIGFLFDSTNDWIASKLDNMEWLSKFENKFLFTKYYNLDEAESQDVLFMLGCTNIVSEEKIRQHGLCLLVHESNLPYGKGFSPVQWQILEGKNEITASLLRASSKVDSGEIVDQVLMKFEGSELLPQIRSIQAEATKKLISKFLGRYPKYRLRKQKNVGEFFFRKRVRSDDELDLQLSLSEQFNHLRIVDNDRYPAFFIKDGVKYYLKISQCFDEGE